MSTDGSVAGDVDVAAARDAVSTHIQVLEQNGHGVPSEPAAGASAEAWRAWVTRIIHMAARVQAHAQAQRHETQLLAQADQEAASTILRVFGAAPSPPAPGSSGAASAGSGAPGLALVAMRTPASGSAAGSGADADAEASSSGGGPSGLRQQEAGVEALAEGAGAGGGAAAGVAAPISRLLAPSPTPAAATALTPQPATAPTPAAAAAPTMQAPCMPPPSSSEAPRCCRWLTWLRAPSARRGHRVPDLAAGRLRAQRRRCHRGYHIDDAPLLAADMRRRCRRSCHQCWRLGGLAPGSHAEEPGEQAAGAGGLAADG
ncbi:hypothetical protein TSOC_006502 [Tetrabaena socialis]|uniref:Uncharacterized protein n=1 Tax=Tetrabaena socialis TaxID=47790 RepID=A0A2J8A3I5_9CHLO|nr:hypothetical protein TSOC_006502 [Tetrabaena socialis]|eukprot:PNH07082.1 hypothetical protein TSOC_006502 [Tetrabaena socialis]